jgi:hypothetical protein
MKNDSFLNTYSNFGSLSITSIIGDTFKSGLIGIVNGSKLTAPFQLYTRKTV